MAWSRAKLDESIPDDLLPVSELAKRLRTGVQPLLRSLERDGIPVHKPAGRWLVSLAAVVEWWKTQSLDEIQARSQLQVDWLKSQVERSA